MNGEQILQLVRELSGRREYIGYDVVNDAYEVILRRTGSWLKRVRDTTSVTFQQSVRMYDLPMDRINRLEGVAVKVNTNLQEWVTLEEVTDERFDVEVSQSRNQDGTDVEDTPKFFRLASGETKQLEVAPTPSGTFSVRLTYHGNPAEITAMVTPVLPVQYHRTIAKLAAAKHLEKSSSEEDRVRARILASEAGASLGPLANDTANNRRGVVFKSQNLLRS